MTPGRRTIVEKIWDDHVVMALPRGRDLVHIDRIFLHERAAPPVFSALSSAGRRVANPQLVFGTMDHIIDTTPGRTDHTLFKGGAAFIQAFRDGARDARIPVFDLDDPRQGIAHVVSPEQGIALPGCTLVCPDSHSSTVGGVGALGWGVGATECEHALATQTLVRKRPRTVRVDLNGQCAALVSAKDVALALIRKYGASGGDARVLEFRGSTAAAFSIEARLTLCNMAVEIGAWTAIVAPDETTFEWIAGRPCAPQGALLDAAIGYWRSLASDDDALWDGRMELDCGTLAPQVTWGTSPDQAGAIDEAIPDPAAAPDSTTRAQWTRAQEYMDLRAGQRLDGVAVEAAFIGSCTNGRLSDLRAAAGVIRGRQVARGVMALVVPGSSQVKAAAEAEGLHRTFIDAGFQWRESGCSLCFFAGGDTFGSARRVISTTNRNFEGRQGPGVRSHLASPATVAASAIAGRIVDPRQSLPEG